MNLFLTVSSLLYLAVLSTAQSPGSIILPIQSILVPAKCTVVSQFYGEGCTFSEIIMDNNNLVCNINRGTINPLNPLPNSIGCSIRTNFVDVLYKVYESGAVVNPTEARTLLDSYIKTYNTQSELVSTNYNTLVVLLGLELRDNVYSSGYMYKPIDNINVYNLGTHLEIVGYVTKVPIAAPTVESVSAPMPDVSLVNRFKDKFTKYFSHK